MSNKLCGSQHNFLCHVAPDSSLTTIYYEPISITAT